MRFRQSELHDLQASYENYVSLTASPNTSTRYAKALEQFFKRFSDRSEPEEFSRRDVEDFKIYRLRDKVSARTVNYEVSVVRAFWNWLIQMERVTWNPASKIKRLREKDPPRVSLSVEQQLALYRVCQNTGDDLLVGLALTTALRGDTLSQLTKQEVDFETNRLVIPADKMKAGRNHEVPLRLREIELLRTLPEGRVFEGYAKNPIALRYKWLRICERAGVPSKGLRTARRTVATTLLRSGSDLRLVQDLLGHRNIATTSRYITPADESTVRDAIEGLPEPDAR